MPEIIAFSDINIYSWSRRLLHKVFPVKGIYNNGKCQSPLLVCSPDNTPIVNSSKDIDCAKIITADDVNSKADEICRWLNSVASEQLRAMGQKGLAEIENKYSKDIVTKQYCNLISQL